jgi:hypothetical protein
MIRIEVLEHLTSGIPQNSPDFDKICQQMESLPYACFIEQQSGLLVLLSYAGYCLKFQLDAKLDTTN